MNSSGSNQRPQARRQVTVDNEHFLPSYQDPTTFPFPDNAVSPFEYSIFPKDIFIYREEYISLILGPPYKANSPRPTPLFYVSIHMDNRWTNNSAVPQIRVYFGPDETYPIIGTSSFRYSTTSDIIIWPNRIYSTNGNSTQEVSSDSGTSFQLTKTSSMMKDMNVFHYRVRTSDGTLTSEKFEWKHSGDPEVQAFATENIPGENISQEKRGLKLVRVSTGEVLALFCGGKHQRVWNPKRVAGKLRFMSLDLLDPLVIVMSILTIIERSRRNATWNVDGFGGCILS